jgi:hypothetical protein
MGLIDLKTDLKSLRYGNDRVYGGNSGQPYITNNIPDDISPYIGTTDFLLRGGINIVRDSATDVLRLGKMFADVKSPNGLLFIAKQQLLSRTSVRTQTSGILNEGSYSPLNTLAEAGLIAFGGHLNKQGINPFADTGAYANNENLYDVKVNPFRNNEATTATNRLAELLRGSSQGRSIDYDGDRVVLNNGANVMTYVGGPGSNLGIGKTGIRYSPSSQTPLTKYPNIINPTQLSSDTGQNDWTYSSKLIAEQPKAIEGNGIATPKVQDFRAVLRSKLQGSAQKAADQSGATANSLTYSVGGAANFTQRVNIGDPGQRGNNDYYNYAAGVLNKQGKSAYGNISNIKGIGDSPLNQFGLDKINSLPIYRSKTVTADPVVNDFVKFRIAVIDNNSPNYKTFMHFRAFLGPVSDAYTANWNGFNYLGRGEQFYTYGGFARQISLSWTVAAQSKEELIPMYKKLNYLASTLAPDYSPNGYMRGNLVQLTIGGYLYEQPGFITSLTYEMGEDSPWEIGVGSTDGSEDGTVKELTQIIRVSGFSFTPIQKFIPRKQELTFSTNITKTTGDDTGFVQSYGNQEFIALANGIGNGDNNYNNDDTSVPVSNTALVGPVANNTFIGPLPQPV